MAERYLPEQLPLVDLTERIREPGVVEIWSLASFDPANLEHRQRVLALYPPTGTRMLYGFEHDGIVLATCGVGHTENGITIHQMVTRPEYRRRGLARKLIEAIVARLDPASVRCGTDAPNDQFYAACGFICESEGIPPSGIERFRCTLTRRS